MTSPLRVALYARVSTTDQSLDPQLDALRRYAGARGWEPQEFHDHGQSGRKEQRDGLKALLGAARRREIDAVAVAKLDRLGRSLAHLLSVLGELESLGVAFVSLDDGIDTQTAAGRLFMQIRGAFAEYEAALIRERTMARLEAAQQRGPENGHRSARLVPGRRPHKPAAGVPRKPRERVRMGCGPVAGEGLGQGALARRTPNRMEPNAAPSPAGYSPESREVWPSRRGQPHPRQPCRHSHQRHRLPAGCAVHDRGPRPRPRRRTPTRLHRYGSTRTPCRPPARTTRVPITRRQLLASLHSGLQARHRATDRDTSS